MLWGATSTYVDATEKLNQSIFFWISCGFLLCYCYLFTIITKTFFRYARFNSPLKGIYQWLSWSMTVTRKSMDFCYTDGQFLQNFIKGHYSNDDKLHYMKFQNNLHPIFSYWHHAHASSTALATYMHLVFGWELQKHCHKWLLQCLTCRHFYSRYFFEVWDIVTSLMTHYQLLITPPP